MTTLRPGARTARVARGPDRQPRRDRRPDRPGLPRRGHPLVAVYADPDRDALHVRVADEAYALGGVDARRLLPRHRQAPRRRAPRPAPTRVHPGYGFLAENADFAQAVIDAGPDLDRPAARRDRRARRQGQGPAHRRSAPAPRSSPGTADPVADADEVVAFADGARAAGRDQGGVRRRRPRAQGRAHHRGDPRAVRVRGARGGRRVRPRRVLRRALPRPAAARRDPVPGRRARQRRRRLDPRLLAAAPPPEARRGGAGAVPDRRAGRASSTARRRRSCARPATSARDVRVPRRPGRHDLASSRSTPGCRSSTP